MWNRFHGKHKDSTELARSVLCLPCFSCLTLSQTLFLQQLYTHIPSPYRIRPLKELLFTETQKWLTWTFGRYLFKKRSSFPSIPSSSQMLTLKICKYKIFTSLGTHVSEQKEKLRHVEVSVRIPHKWGILIKQKQIWIALKGKKIALLQTQVVVSKSLLYRHCIRVPQLTPSNCTIHAKNNHYLLPA